MNTRILMAVGIVALMAGPALAITYGVPDGKGHPEVGALVGNFTSGTFPYCSGTLIAPNVFLTAAHCDIGNPRVLVTFDPAFSDKAKLYAGTYYANPLYGGGENDPHDVAVVVLDKAMSMTPARLPTAGQCDALASGQRMTSVGYGSTAPVTQPGGIVNPDSDGRQVSVGTLDAVNKDWLHISQNPATDDGGTCYGDSGGPNFIGGFGGETNIVAAITVTGDAYCHATNTTYRMDSPSAREFLGQFVVLP